MRAHETPDEDDLAGLRTPLGRLGAHARRWVAVLVAAAMLLPAGWWAVEEVRFLRSGAQVVETLEGELSGEAVADTVLLVHAVGCDPRTRGTGSAFVVDTGDGPLLVTNRHVVEDTRQVGVRALDGSTPVRVEEVLVSRAADVAVLAVDEPSELPPALTLAESDPQVGDDVRLVGFPAAMPLTAAGRIADVGGSRLLLDLEVDPGASGSPVVGDDGRVVGQVFAVADDGLGLATPTPRLLEAIAGSRPREPC